MGGLAVENRKQGRVGNNCWFGLRARRERKDEGEGVQTLVPERVVH